MPTLEFVLPELGENVASGDVLRVLVKPGDPVSRDQPVLELETDKATIEVPSSIEGTVRDVRVKEGDKIQVGQVVFVAEGEAGAEEEKSKAKADEPGPAAAAPSSKAAESSGGTPQAVRRSKGESRGVPKDTATPPDVELEQATAPAAPSPAQDGPAPGSDAAPIQAGPIEFALPELGENVADGDVVRVLVKVGDTIERDQTVLELETDKATVEVPSSIGGIVREVRVKEGEKIKVGQPVLIVEGSVEAGAAVPASAPPAKAAASRAARPASVSVPAPFEDDGRAGGGADEEVGASTDTDYDYAGGGLDQRVPGRVRRSGSDKPGMHEDALAEAAADSAPARPRAEVVSIKRGSRPGSEQEAARTLAPAAPSVRRTARELGVDISQVPGSGPGGRITADDVRGYVKRIMASGGPTPAVAAPSAPAAAAAPAELPDFTKWGEVERKAMRAVRRKTAEHLAQAWAQVPHVTQFDKVDITALEDLRKRFAPRAESAGGKLTVTAIALKVVAAALKTFPQFNSSIDAAAGEIVYKRYVHVGVAVDTDRGLLVPVIRDVDRKNILELAGELAQLSEKARSGKLALEEMQGGCFTISNLGGIGGTAFTPIVNYPEVAILGMSRAVMEPAYLDGQFQPRLMLPLSLSYDHRVIDGADAIRFLRWVCEALEQPFLLLLQG